MSTHDQAVPLPCTVSGASHKAMVEVIEMSERESGILPVGSNKILFILEGCIEFTLSEKPDIRVDKGQMLFLPSGEQYPYRAISNNRVMIFRLDDPVVPGDNSPIEKLYTFNDMHETEKDRSISGSKQKGVLDIRTPLQGFVEVLDGSISEGINCESYFRLKTKELMILLPAYYPEKELRDFFHPILSRDIAFSEYIRLNWYKFRTVNELAASMMLSPKQFFRRFVAVFRETPYRWMMEHRAHLVRREIQTTNKPFKQIAFEYNFSSDAQLTRFCKDNLGKTPTQIRNI